MKQTTFLRYILTQKSFSRILNRENKSSGIIDWCPGCSWPHIVHPIAKISRVKRVHWSVY